jgi:5-methylcytosine-specific restriction endonuclease McrA
MSRSVIAKYVNPWKFRREQNAQRLHALRQRDGDTCSRCKRPMRFDLPAGHELAAKVEAILPGPAGGTEALDNLVLCHGRCNAQTGDMTAEIRERLRLQREAALFSQERKKRRRA